MDYKTDMQAIEPAQTIGNKTVTRERPSIVDWHGLEFAENKSVLLGDGRYRARIALRRPGSEELLTKKVTIHAKTMDELELKEEEMRYKLALGQMDVLFELIRSGQYPDAQFGLYYVLRHDDVQMKKKWAGKTEEYDSLWQDVLSPRFEKIPIKELAFEERTRAEMAAIYNHAGHRKTSDQEKMCWIQLSGFFDMLKEDKIFPANPIEKIAAKHQYSMSQDIFWRLSARSLSAEELLQYVDACMKIEDSNLRTCMLLHVLMGLSIYELCGLNLGSWVRFRDLSWLEIEQEYYQSRGQEGIIREMLKSVNQYRKAVCTDVIEWLLAKHIKQRKAEGAEKSDPMFVSNGERLLPNLVKSKENELLDEVMAPGMHIAIQGRGKKRTNTRDRARTDVPRGTAIFHYYYTAKMTRAQISVMCGIDRIHTYAVWYVDWNNLEIMRYMKQEISLWHNEVFHFARNGKALQLCTQRGNRSALCLHGKAQPGAFLELQAPCGADGCLQEIK